MGQIAFDFDIENYLRLEDGEISPMEFIEPILQKVDHHDDPGAGNASQIINRLLSYHDSDGGAPEISDFDVVEVSYDESTKSGKIEISYWIYRYYGCSDLNTSDDDYETWTYKIDVENCMLIIDIIDYEPLTPGEEL